LPGVVRVSIGIENGEEDVDTLILVLGKIAKKSRASADNHSYSKEIGTSILSRAEVKKQINDFADVAIRRVYSHP